MILPFGNMFYQNPKNHSKSKHRLQDQNYMTPRNLFISKSKAKPQTVLFLCTHIILTCLSATAQLYLNTGENKTNCHANRHIMAVSSLDISLYSLQVYHSSYHVNKGFHRIAFSFHQPIGTFCCTHLRKLGGAGVKYSWVMLKNSSNC